MWNMDFSQKGERGNACVTRTFLQWSSISRFPDVKLRFVYVLPAELEGVLYVLLVNGMGE